MTNHFEAEVVIGLEDIAIDELRTISDINTNSVRVTRDGFIRFTYEGLENRLLKLRSVIAIYAIYHFDIPRPKSILGHQNFTYLSNVLNQRIEKWKTKPNTFGIGAAGSDSTVFQRIKHEISDAIGLDIADDDKGELFIRFVPARDKSGWEILIRLTSHPLSARHWRHINIPGALNATVAFAMTQFANTESTHQILNLCSGTATILIEQAHKPFDNPLLALDNDIDMLKSAFINIEASSKDNIRQLLGEAQQTPFQPNTFDMLYADLPFGHHIGSHNENEWLYPAILSESERIAKQSATFVMITHEITLFEQSLQTSSWSITHSRQINLSGLHPTIFVLERK